jgi:predicted nucleic acid-binding protein
MASKTLTFVDASVLIYAASKPSAVTLARRLTALQVLGDPDREFLSSEFLRLEVLPIPFYFQKRLELAFYQKFFAGLSVWANSSSLLAAAYPLASQFELGAMDALHVAAAAAHGAELISAEKPTKPLYRAYPTSTTIY